MHSLAEQSGTVLRQEPILCKDGCADEKKKNQTTIHVERSQLSRSHGLVGSP